MSLTIVGSAQVGPAALVRRCVNAVQSLDPQLPINFRTLIRSFHPRWTSAAQPGHLRLFGAVALLAGRVGIYGVTYLRGRATHTGDRDPNGVGSANERCAELVLRRGCR